MTSTQFRHVSQDLVPCGPCQKRTVRIQSAPPSTMRKSVLWELVGWRHKKSENSGRTFEHAYVSLCSCYVGVIGTSRRPGCGNPVRWRGLSSRALEPLSHVSHAKRTRCNLLCNIAYKENYWANFQFGCRKKIATPKRPKTGSTYIALILDRICQIELEGSCVPCHTLHTGHVHTASSIMLRKGWERGTASRTRWTIRPCLLTLSHLGSRCGCSRCALQRCNDITGPFRRRRNESMSGTPGDRDPSPTTFLSLA